MKTTLFAIITLLCVHRSYAREIEPVEPGKLPVSSKPASIAISIPTFQVDTLSGMASGFSTSKEVDQVSQSNLKKLIFDPSLRLISNRGGFTTSFSTSLPKYFISLKGLTFSYFTQFRDSTFLGNGWRWNIPYIAKRESLNKLPFSIEGHLGSGDLIKTNKLNKEVRSKVEDILTSHNEYVSNLTTEVYEINYSGNENLFIKLSGVNNSWIVLTPNGESWLFNKHGHPISVEDSFGHNVSFNWEAELLKKILYGNNISVDFNYSQEGLLQNIVKSSKDTEKTFEFKYKEKKLIFASYRNAILPTFQGAYKDLYEKIEVTNYILGTKNYKSETISPSLKLHESEVRINFQKYQEEINEIIKGQKFYTNEYRKYQEYFVIDGYRGKQLEKMLNEVPLTLSLDNKEIALPKDLRPFSLDVTFSDVWNHHNYTHIIQNHFKVASKRTLFLVDVNNDGEKDIVSCPVSGEKISFLQSVLNKLKNKDQGSYGDVGNSLIYLAKWSSHNSNSSVELEVDRSKNFKCNENTFFLDWDKDGRVDFLNNNSVLLNKRDGLETQTINISDYKKKFISYVKTETSKMNLVVKDLNNDGTYEVFDSNYLVGKSIDLHQNIGVLSSIYGSFGGRVDIDYRMYKNKQLLPVAFHYSGDNKVETEKIIYRMSSFNDNKQAFDEIFHVTDSVFKRKYYCNANLLDVEKRKLTSELCSVTNYSSSEEFNYFSKVERQRSDDLSALHQCAQGSGVGQNRFGERIQLVNPYGPRTIGPLFKGLSKEVSSQILPLDYNPYQIDFNSSQESTRDSDYVCGSSPATSEYLFVPSENGINSVRHYTAVDTKDVNIPHGKSMYNTYESVLGRMTLSKVSHSDFYLMDGMNSREYFNQKETRYSFSNGLKNKSLSMVNDIETETNYTFNKINYIKKNDSKVSFKVNKELDKTFLSKDIYLYEDVLNNPSSVITYSDSDLSAPMSIKKYKYDSEGRVVKKYNFDEEISSLEYFENSAFVRKSKKLDIISEFNYDFLTSSILSKNVDNKIYQYHYSEDGILLDFTLDGEYQYSFNIPKVKNNEFPKEYKRTIEEIKKDETFTHELDSMGRVVRTDKSNSNYWEKYNYSLMGTLISKEDPMRKFSYSNREGSNCVSESILSKENDQVLSSKETCRKGEDVRSINDGIESFRNNLNGRIEDIRVGENSLSPKFSDNLSLRKFDELNLQWSTRNIGNKIQQSFQFDRPRSVVTPPYYNFLGNIYNQVEEEVNPIENEKEYVRTYNSKSRTLVDEYENQFSTNLYGKLTTSFSKIDNPFILNVDNTYDVGKLIVSSVGMFEHQFNYENGIVKSIKIEDENFLYEYDKHFRVESKSWNSSNIKYSYDNGLVNSAYPIIKSLDRDSLERIDSITYSNGTVINYSIDALGRIHSQKLSHLGKELFSSSVSYNKYQKVASVNTSSFSKTTTKTFDYIDKYEERHRHIRYEFHAMIRNNKPTKYTIDSVVDLPSLPNLVRNLERQAENVSGYRVSYSNDNPVSLIKNDREVFQFFTPSGEMKGSCIDTQKLDLYSENCWYKIDDNHFKVMGDSLALESLDGRPVGVFVNSDFYPGIFDYRGSLVGLTDSESGELLFIRNYSDFGIKSVTFNPDLNEEKLSKAMDLEKKVLWSFAKLYENPFTSGDGIYFSKSRLLSAHNGEWLTFDPMLKWNPENLFHSPVDMNGLKYVNGDPVNFVDPSGNFAVSTTALGAGIVIGGSFGAVSAYIASNGNITASQLIQATIIGAGAGATGVVAGASGLGALALSGVNGLIGGTANIISQLSSGTSLDKVNINQAALSAGIGLTSGLIGMGVGNRSLFNTPVIGNTIGNINSLTNGQAAGVIAGGISGGAMGSFSSGFSESSYSGGINAEDYSFGNFTF